MEVVDTNVILRYLVGDNQKQHAMAVRWFAEAENGKRKLIIKPVVIAEVCFVLESFYKKTRTEISQALEIFLSQRWLLVEERDVMLNIWPNYIKNLHFVDSYLIAAALDSSSTLLTFDRQLQKRVVR